MKAGIALSQATTRKAVRDVGVQTDDEHESRPLNFPPEVCYSAEAVHHMSKWGLWLDPQASLGLSLGYIQTELFR